MTKSTAEVQSWIPILPIPGVFSHPTYGKIEISASRNANFVRNLNDRVYGQDLPIDAEHQTKLSGAFGWIKEARLNEDGSADAKVEWNERGEEIFRIESHRYISPEWYDVWTEPLSGQQYEDVLVGAALTTRPYFKSPNLRPLIACGDGRVYLSDVGPVSDGPESVSIFFTELAAVSSERKEDRVSDAMQFTEEEVKEFRELKAKDAERDAQMTAQAEALKKLNGEIREKKFTDLVRGRGGEGDGATWPGAIDANVKDLLALAEAVGEDSEIFTNHVARMQETAKTLKESGAFQPIGTTEGGDAGGSAWDRIEAKARTYAEAQNVTHAAAVKHILETDRELANEYAKER